MLPVKGLLGNENMRYVHTTAHNVASHCKLVLKEYPVQMHDLTEFVLPGGGYLALLFS